MNATLVSRLFPSPSLSKDAALVVGGATLTAVCSQIAIPWIPVPFTLQTFAVLLCGLVLGSRRGMLSQATFVAAGAAGLPVFQGFTGGFLRLAGPTGGYLIGFILAAGVVGMLAEREWDRKILSNSVAIVAGSVVILGMGCLWLSHFVGLPKAFWSGVVPFLPGDAIKAIAAACALPVAWRFVK